MSVELILGLVAGLLFGVLLQKSRVLRYEKQIGFMRFEDMTVLKFMLSVIVVAAVGLYICQWTGLMELKVFRTK